MSEKESKWDIQAHDWEQPNAHFDIRCPVNKNECIVKFSGLAGARTEVTIPVAGLASMTNVQRGDFRQMAKLELAAWAKYLQDFYYQEGVHAIGDIASRVDNVRHETKEPFDELRERLENYAKAAAEDKLERVESDEEDVLREMFDAWNLVKAKFGKLTYRQEKLTNQAFDLLRAAARDKVLRERGIEI